MKKIILTQQNEKNIKNHKFFIFSELPIDWNSKKWFKGRIDFADSRSELMQILKDMSALSIMTKLGLTDKLVSDEQCDEYIEYYKKEYEDNYNQIYRCNIDAYYTIRQTTNDYINDAQNCNFNTAFDNSVKIYEENFNKFYVFDSFEVFYKHIADKYNRYNGFDDKAFDSLCKSDVVDESKFMRLTFQSCIIPLPMKVSCL